MGAWFAYYVTLRIECGHCQSQAYVEARVPAGGRPPAPMLPEGWHEVDGVPVCTAHRVAVDTELFTADRQLIERLVVQLERECPGLGEIPAGYWKVVARLRLEELLWDLLGQVRPRG